MNFNTALINGDMARVKYLLGKGKGWVGSKDDFDRNVILHPHNSVEFAQHLKLILDLELRDNNYCEGGTCFTWYFQLSLKELEKLEYFSDKTNIYQTMLLKCYKMCLKDTLKKMETYPEKYDDTPLPQILISKSERAYKINVERYTNQTGDSTVMSLFIDEKDKKSILSLLGSLSEIKVYTC